ncbi:hypothetical protein [Rubrivirga sp. IMCC43871]|uniref:hypothetical protein n=1 Tax=Rubrivirga sp. IMCC43871 TaxID=3391575 RepID=UPI00398FEC26
MSSSIRPVSRLLLALPIALLLLTASAAAAPSGPDSHDDLLALFADWRAFERPPMRDGAPDYTASTFAAREPGFRALRARLDGLDTTGWAIPSQVDWHLVRAEMNGYDFNQRVLMPWARDPAFYQSVWPYRSDVPAHEGPTHHAVTELWTYSFPLSPLEEERLIADLGVIAPLMAQAQLNLTGNARELWIAGIRNIRTQRTILDGVREQASREGGSEALLAVIAEAAAATDTLVAWLEAQAPSKTGPSGIGKNNYTWWQQNVHLVPLTWEDEVRLLKRELDRAWASLALEEHRNRDLAPLSAASTPAEYDALAEDAVQRFMAFLDDQDVMTVTGEMEPALREKVGSFVPEDRRNFFLITSHLDPLPLFTHFVHWFELARMDTTPHPSPVRGPLLYNIWDSRNEGTATGVEEMFMHAGLYDDSPRSRELVWVLLAQRAARGLGSLYAHANEMTMEEAGSVHVTGTPRGWMSTEPELLIFEQHLYLRQPGYGTSYVTGKYLLERTLADATRLAAARGEALPLGAFFDRLHAIDSIPISLARWEMTGLDDEIRALTADQ